jgi:hypothetical protein
MALMFTRLARNFVKNGYFPTDDETLARVLNALDVTHSERVNLLDPCCGEGAALADISSHLKSLGADVRAYGVEYDQERAANARGWLDVVAHGDINEVAIKPRQFNLLFLNPPYGDMVSDAAALSDPTKRQRLEKHFFRLAHPWLAFGGVSVLIVPSYVVDREFATLLSRSYKDIRAFTAPEQKFKQVVIFGIKQKVDRFDPKTVEMLTKISEGEIPPVLPEVWSGAPYQVAPASTEDIHFVMHRMNADGLSHELSKATGTLWSQFDLKFGNDQADHRRPLRTLRPWHLALALAAGQVSGVVRSADGQRQLLVKGDTHKDKSFKVTYEHAADGSVTEIRKSTDKFVPVIRAIDFTPGESLGQMINIQ